MKTTHAMVSEFTVQPKHLADVDKAQTAVMSLTIPRLKKYEITCFRLANPQGMKITHYNGPKKSNPPVFHEIPRLQSDVDKLNASVEKANSRDAGYFFQLQRDDSVE